VGLSAGSANASAHFLVEVQFCCVGISLCGDHVRDSTG
jgi:hypothetical protein